MAQARVAIVTGAASNGLGRAIALRLAQVSGTIQLNIGLLNTVLQDGLDVAVNDLPQQKDKLDEVVKLVQAKGRRSLAVCADVSEEGDVKELVAKVVKEFGGIDVVSPRSYTANPLPLYSLYIDGR